MQLDKRNEIKNQEHYVYKVSDIIKSRQLKM
jgi:hypothetical protein